MREVAHDRKVANKQLRPSGCHALSRSEPDRPSAGRLQSFGGQRNDQALSTILSNARSPRIAKARRQPEPLRPGRRTGGQQGRGAVGSHKHGVSGHAPRSPRYRPSKTTSAAPKRANGSPSRGWAAKALIDMHGSRAARVAAQRAENARIAGSKVAALNWQQIAQVIEQMQPVP